MALSWPEVVAVLIGGGVWLWAILRAAGRPGGRS